MVKALALICSSLLALHASAAQLTVHAAASLTDAIKEIGAAYEKESGDKLRLNFDASSVLARQIEEGAPADIFISADEAKMDALEKAGLIAAGTRRTLLRNTLVIVVPAESGKTIQSAADLTASDIKKIALAQPESVPAGIYAKQFLTAQGLWEKVAAKVVPTQNVRATLAAVESGNVEAGFVYKTDALISNKVKVAFEIPPGAGPKITYPAAALAKSTDLAAARRFLAYLESAPAAAVFRKYGFVLAGDLPR